MVSRTETPDNADEEPDGKEKEKTAYHYLPASIKVVPQGKEMTAILTKCGFKEAKFCTFTFGICSMYTGIK